ncbi:DUF3006 domain-containing protein [Soehngenia longivitae]|uniref:DUF3006 domain-containing protein n=1 Tax=Soehngenia longivitae TaxID=2562294 RepID=A0A4Z0D8A8_9FIRM|nr:DUF3006 domain-containing protein [Soehngenia longivitae]TFZ41083.1 DUF3006 domain-containing protein [Soehngenia longivitae]
MKTIGIVDRFEENLVIVELFDDFYLFPRGLFPEDISEGDVVSIDIEIDKESTSDRKKKMEEKLKKLIEKNE